MRSTRLWYSVSIAGSSGRVFFRVLMDHSLNLDSTEINPGYALYDHQRDVVDRLMKVLADNRDLTRVPEKRVVAHLPTGAGKTRVACHSASQLLRDSNRDHPLVVWLASSEELCDQAASELKRAWEHLGTHTVNLYRHWGNSQLDIRRLSQGFLVAGIGKLWNLVNHDRSILSDLSRHVACVIFDEAHQSVAPTYEFITEQLLTHEPPLLGLTATPGRGHEITGSDLKLAELFRFQKVGIDPQGHPNPVAFLTSNLFLARPSFVAIDFNAADQVVRQTPKEGTDYSVGVLNSLGRDDTRTLAIADAAEEALIKHSRVMVFCPSVHSATTCAGVLKERGFDAPVVTARTPSEERQNAMRRYRGHSDAPVVLVNHGVFTAGVDAPQTSAVVIGRPTLSLVLYSQMMGRGLRGPRVGGNRWCEIYTVVDRQLPGFSSVADAFTNWEAMWSSQI